jgi:VanZ family protein
MALIFLLSSQSSFPLPASLVQGVPQKVAHGGEYAVLGFLLCRALMAPDARPSAGLFVRAMAIAVAYAVSDEVHQSFVPNRGPSFFDILIDAAGALGGATAWRWWHGRALQPRGLDYTERGYEEPGRSPSHHPRCACKQ